MTAWFGLPARFQHKLALLKDWGDAVIILAIGAIVAAYIGSAELAKRWFYRRYGT